MPISSKNSTFTPWEEFRQWAESHGWILLIYDPPRSIFITPEGHDMVVNTDNDDFVTCVWTGGDKD